MKNKKNNKKNKVKQLNQDEINFYKQYLVYNEFQKIIENVLFFELEEEHYEFIQRIITFDLIADFSDYGYDVFDLDFIDYYEGDKCFLCFIKFHLDDFIDCMFFLYDDETSN